MQISKPDTEGWLGKTPDNSFDNYQKEEYDRAISRVKNFRTSIDLGANLGIMSKRMVKNFQFVHSFEPLFHDHLRKNVPEKNIKIYPYAVGDKEKIEMMRVGIYHSGGSNIVTNVDDITNLTEVKVVTVDSFDIKDVDFIKIDVEDYEIYALKGAENTIAKYRPTILIELKKDNTYHEQILDFFEKLDYKREIVGEIDSVFYAI
jgi:FkbM family methyltransferase